MSGIAVNRKSEEISPKALYNDEIISLKMEMYLVYFELWHVGHDETLLVDS
jgi:hypothetical protein